MFVDHVALALTNYDGSSVLLFDSAQNTGVCLSYFNFDESHFKSYDKVATRKLYCKREPK